MKLLTGSLFLLAMLALTTAANEFCPLGWTQYSNRCFFYVSKPMSWGEAQKNCQTMGANLASVQSLEEYQAIQEVISDASKTSRAWIGGTDGHQDGYWFWIDGTRFAYTNWCLGEPNNYNNKPENCLEMNFPGKLCMNDVDCSFPLASVCGGRIF